MKLPLVQVNEIMLSVLVMTLIFGEIDLDALSSNRISNKDKIDFNSASTVLGSGSSYRGSWRIFNFI